MKLKIVKLKMKIKNENVKYIFVKTLSIKFLSDMNIYIFTKKNFI